MIVWRAVKRLAIPMAIGVAATSFVISAFLWRELAGLNTKIASLEERASDTESELKTTRFVVSRLNSSGGGDSSYLSSQVSDLEDEMRKVVDVLETLKDCDNQIIDAMVRADRGQRWYVQC